MARTGQYRVPYIWIKDRRDGRLVVATSTQPLSLTGRGSQSPCGLVV
jgi:hypothetical protein